MAPQNLDSIFFTPTNPNEILTLINAMPNKSGPIDSIPSFLYKSIANSLAPPLSQLINASIQQGTFPDCLKSAKIIPIHKSGDKKKRKIFVQFLCYMSFLKSLKK